MVERNIYYDILEKTQKGFGDVAGWLVWFLNCFTRALARSQEIMDGAWTKARIWQQYDQFKLSERQKKEVNRLFDAGPEGFESRVMQDLRDVLCPCSFVSACFG